ncbi:DUF397 domain-containing protein [Streptomyces sp. NPDC017936]|uniref:DUF397 domain-containing protein n=1 Tax=Streptomyces sp. NPDC017936 TaxID=3365016 RepID=UPI00378A59A5
MRLEKAQCVQAAQSDACPTVPVRDSENPTDPVADIGADAWTAFAGPLPGVEVRRTRSRGLESGHG